MRWSHLICTFTESPGSSCSARRHITNLLFIPSENSAFLSWIIAAAGISWNILWHTFFVFFFSSIFLLSHPAAACEARTSQETEAPHNLSTVSRLWLGNPTQLWSLQQKSQTGGEKRRDVRGRLQMPKKKHDVRCCHFDVLISTLDFLRHFKNTFIYSYVNSELP